MKKNIKIVIVFVVGVLCAILAATLVFVSVSPKKTTIYVFKDDYTAGTPISGKMLRAIEVDSRIVNAGHNTDVSTCFITIDTYTKLVKNGDVLNTDVVAGTPLMTTTLNDKANNSVEVLMGKTSVAVTIPVNNTTGVTANINAESYVNIYVTYNSGGTYLLLENVRVLNAVNNKGSLSGITLELDNASAVQVINAVNTGHIYCGLVNETGYIYEDSSSEP